MNSEIFFRKTFLIFRLLNILLFPYVTHCIEKTDYQMEMNTTNNIHSEQKTEKSISLHRKSFYFLSSN